MFREASTYMDGKVCRHWQRQETKGLARDRELVIAHSSALCDGVVQAMGGLQRGGYTPQWDELHVLVFRGRRQRRGCPTTQLMDHSPLTRGSKRLGEGSDINATSTSTSTNTNTNTSTSTSTSTQGRGVHAGERYV